MLRRREAAADRADTDRLYRAGELKAELLAFAGRVPRVAKEYDRVLARFGPMVVGSADEKELINAIDRFLLQDRLADRRTVVEHFVGSHPELAQEDREMLLGWREVVEGIFEVRGTFAGGVDALNLLDELSYTLLSNSGPGPLAHLCPGDFLLARAVPFGDSWMLSGVQTSLSASDRDAVVRAAAEVALRYPRAALRNPAKAARAWELQERERALFVEFFGADLVIIPGEQVHERWREFWTWRVGQHAVLSERSWADFELPEHFADEVTVGFIYDAVEGLTFLTRFGQFAAAYENPEQISREQQEIVLGYLKDDTVSPLPFRRMAHEHPDTTSRLFQRLLNKQAFQWGRHGEALLRRYKPDYFDRPAAPTVTVLSATLAEVIAAA